MTSVRLSTEFLDSLLQVAYRVLMITFEVVNDQQSNVFTVLRREVYYLQALGLLLGMS